MSRMNQVIQIGEVGGNIHYYIEDYVYTYLKKQEGKEKTKYFLYGEKEEDGQQEKLYIYGIAEKPKMEQTYFKEYYPLGFLKIKNGERIWVSLKGQEQKITGFYVFYAPNQAMQEYLVDHHEEEKEDKPENKVKRQPMQEGLPVKEVAVPAMKYRIQKKKKENQNENFVFSFVGIAVAVMLVFLLTSANGQKKIEIFKRVIVETMAGAIKETPGNDIVIEEKKISQTDNVQQKEEMISEELPDSKLESAKKEEYQELPEEVLEEGLELKEEAVLEEGLELKKEAVLEEGLELKEEPVLEEESLPKEEPLYNEYVVKEGDSLASICKNTYGTLSKIQEICSVNNIENADYIQPGQKIYLPR